VATAILAKRQWIAFDGIRRHGLLCGIGVCFECVVTVDGLPGERACMTRVAPGMQVTTTDPAGGPDAEDPRPRR
jgi:predicted molibdopterin-dependent oxidoreductase YjgC